MQLHIRGGTRFCKCGTERCFCEHRKRQRVIFRRSTNPDPSLH
jgi:hypothetical protein